MTAAPIQIPAVGSSVVERTDAAPKAAADYKGREFEASRLLERSFFARWSVRTLILTGGMVYLSWGPLTTMLDPQAIDPLGERLAVGGLAIVLFALSLIPALARWGSRFLQLLALTGLAHLFTLLVRNSLADTYLAGMLVLVATSCPLFTTRRETAAVALFILVGTILVATLGPSPNTERRLRLVVSVSTIVIASGLFNWRSAAFRRAAMDVVHEQAVAFAKVNQEVKALRGLLPICMHCSNIRGEQNGSGGPEWQRVEDYVAARAEVKFTHSICPSCMARHYGE